MAENDNKDNAADAKRKPAKVGDAVQLVLCRGKRVPAQVSKVKKGEMVDLEFEDPFAKGPDKKPLVATITDSPRDDTFALADSWSPVEA